MIPEREQEDLEKDDTQRTQWPKMRFVIEADEKSRHAMTQRGQQGEDWQ